MAPEHRPLSPWPLLAALAGLLAVLAGSPVHGDRSAPLPGDPPAAAGARLQQPSGPADGEPECAWTPGFEGRDLDGGVSALAVHDDGSGPALYAGGRFSTAGGLASRNIARWRCTAQIFADGFESGDLSAWSGAASGR